MKPKQLRREPTRREWKRFYRTPFVPTVYEKEYCEQLVATHGMSIEERYKLFPETFLSREEYKLRNLFWHHHNGHRDYNGRKRMFIKMAKSEFIESRNDIHGYGRIYHWCNYANWYNANFSIDKRVD